MRVRSPVSRPRTNQVSTRLSRCKRDLIQSIISAPSQTKLVSILRSPIGCAKRHTAVFPVSHAVIFSAAFRPGFYVICLLRPLRMPATIALHFVSVKNPMVIGRYLG